MKIRIILCIAVFAILGFGQAAAQTPLPTRGFVFIVNSTADSVDLSPGDEICADAAGRCTLRAAIGEAIPHGARSAILFDLPQPSVIELNLGELTPQNVEIVGPGARKLTVQRSSAAGTPSFRVFRISADQRFLGIRGMTIRNGHAAGGAGGGVYVESAGNVVISDVAVTENRADHGGGAAIATGRLEIVRSLFTGNVADVQGGGVASTGTGAQTFIHSTTLTANSAPTAGAIDNKGALVLINNTLTQNMATTAASSILSQGSGIVRVLNSIIGRDFSPTATSLQGAFQSAGNNIVTDSRNSSGFVNGVNADKVSENNVIDPLLGPLTNNGGELDSLALLTGSPAIDAGNNCANTTCPQLPGVVPQARRDQRAFRRFIFGGGTFDIGSFETGAGPSNSSASIGLSIAGGPAAGRFVNSPAVLIDPTTLEKRYAMMLPYGRLRFNNIPGDKVFVIEIKTKRKGIVTPLVFAPL